MGCRAATPKLVGLAKRLEDKPFHLVASHGQQISSRDQVKVHLEAHKMWSFQPNLTITKDGGHPHVKGKLNEDGVPLMPYYMVFDHTGRLVKHAMGGPYHDGDRWTMIRVVDELLAAMPAIYLGPEPYEGIDELVAEVSKGKHLGTVVKKIDRALAGEPDAETKAELERLLKRLALRRDRRLAWVKSLEGSDPQRVLPTLKAMAKAFKGTSLATRIDAQLTAMDASKTLAAAIDLQKRYGKIRKRYESVKPKKRTDALNEKTLEKVEALLEGCAELGFAEVVRAWLVTLG